MKNIFTIFLFFAGFAIHKSQSCSSLSVSDLAGNESVYVDCDYPLINGECLTLTATFPEIRNTSSYQVASVPFTPYIPFNSGTPLNANFDDIYAEKVSLPFNFCFFGQYYDQVVIGSNGLITFDLSRLGKISYPNIEHTNPHPLLPGNSIYGIFQDLVFSNTDQSEIYYSIIGTQFCRKLVINFYEGRNAGCEERSSTQIVISEFTNEIEIFVDKKPIPCETAKFENTLLGIMNVDGTVGYSPAGRNTGVWEAFQEAWKFSPDGNIATPQIEWFDENNNSLGFGYTKVVCPAGNTKFTAKATFNFCGGPITVTDTIDVNFAPDFPLAKNYTKTFCKTPATPENINLNDYKPFLTPQNPVNLLFTYHLSLADAQSGTNPQDPNVSLNSDTIFYVRVQNPADVDCFRTAELKIQFIDDIAVGNRVVICDSNNDGVENNFLLANLNSQLFPPGFSGNITYYATQSDAQNNINPLTTANITSSTQLWLRITTAPCSQVSGPISVNFTPGPSVTTPIDYVINICDIHDDKMEPYDFHLLVSPLITTDPNLTLYYYATYQQAFTGGGTEIGTVKEGQYSIFVRVEEKGGCFSIVEIKLDVKFSKVEVIKKTVNLCFDGSEDVTVDLDALSQAMLISPLTGISKSYHINAADAETGVSPISSAQIITDDGNLVTKIFFVRFELAKDCYTVRPITIVLTHPVAMKNSFGVCDSKNDSTENVALTQFNSAIAGTQSATVTWFQTMVNAQNDSGAITTFTATGNNQLFVRVTVNGCTEIYPVTLNLLPTPDIDDSVDVFLDNVCDNNNDGREMYDLTQHQNQIYSGAQPVQFSYYAGFNVSNNTFSGLIPNPNVYSAGTDNTVYVKVHLTGGICFSVSVLKIKIKFLPSIILSEATIVKCDEQFNFNEVFNLNDAIATMYDASQNTVPLSNITVTYYATDASAQAGVASTQISSNYKTEQSLVTVYARFESKTTGCYSVKPIHLKTYFPPKAINSKITGICDSDLDGSYEVNLTNYTAQMVDIQNSENSFKFYVNLTDAQNNTNHIADPTNFEVNPFPTRIWVKVENIPGCRDIAFIDLQTGTKIPVNNAQPYVINSCDTGNDGTETVDLTQYESMIYAGAVFQYFPTLVDLNNGTNAIANPANFSFVSGTVTDNIFVKVSSGGFCPALVKIRINLNKSPVFAVPTQYFCPYNNGKVDVKPDFSGLNLVSYEWRNPSGQVVSTNSELMGVNVTGIYTVKVTANNGCSFTTTFEVKNYEVPVIKDLIPNGNSYTVIATGSKTILYSIDGINWQPGNVFPNLPQGVITFYVKFADESCIGLPQQGLMVIIPNVVTPNADGSNDVWIVKDLHVFGGKTSSVQIYDRFGALIFSQQSATEFRWNGYWLGRPAPTTSYWYVVTLPDGRTFNNWILVKNRN